jgi:hypothetical protein
MENRELLVIYAWAWIFYVVGIHRYAQWKRLSHPILVVSHAAPSLVAISMTYIFLISHGATVRQFVAGSERGMDLWSLWVGLWPLLLLVTFGSGITQAGWTIVVTAKREWRGWIPVALFGAAMSGFAFVTVMSNFPDA